MTKEMSRKNMLLLLQLGHSPGAVSLEKWKRAKAVYSERIAKPGVPLPIPTNLYPCLDTSTCALCEVQDPGLHSCAGCPIVAKLDQLSCTNSQSPYQKTWKGIYNGASPDECFDEMIGLLEQVVALEKEDMS